MASAAGSVRTSKTRQTQAISLDSITIEAARCTKDLHEAATFFVDAFWGDSTSSSKSLELSPQGRAAMIGEQCEDMEERYGELVGSRRLQSKLLIARDPNGEIAGCIGVELAVMSVVDKTVLPRRRDCSHFTRAQHTLALSHQYHVFLCTREGEQIFKREFDAMSGRERKQYRNMPLQVQYRTRAATVTSTLRTICLRTQELAAQILEPGYGVCPLIANLAVGTDYRGSGLSRELCFRVEDLVDASGWGYGGIVLQVRNVPLVLRSPGVLTVSARRARR